MARIRNVNAAIIATAGWMSAVHAYGLDVKPGLWEIAMDGAPQASQVCYTAAVLDGDFSNVQMPPGIECRNDVKESSGTRVVTHSTCSGQMSIEGDTVLEVQNPESMTMQSTSVMSFGGQQQTVRVSARYRFLDAECGSVKPFDPNALR